MVSATARQACQGWNAGLKGIVLKEPRTFHHEEMRTEGCGQESAQ